MLPGKKAKMLLNAKQITITNIYFNMRPVIWRILQNASKAEHVMKKGCLCSKSTWKATKHTRSVISVGCFKMLYERRLCWQNQQHLIRFEELGTHLCCCVMEPWSCYRVDIENWFCVRLRRVGINLWKEWKNTLCFNLLLLWKNRNGTVRWKWLGNTDSTLTAFFSKSRQTHLIGISVPRPHFFTWDLEPHHN